MEKTQGGRLEQMADAIVPEAIAWVAELRKYRVYQGKDPEYFRKARIGVGIVGAGVRLLATVENNHSNELIARRLTMGPAPLQLPAAAEGRKQ